VLCICVFALGCDDHTATPVQLNLSFDKSHPPPSAYDCEEEGRFEVRLMPNNHPQVDGDYLKMLFWLEHEDYVCYESNDIDFPLSTDSIQTAAYTLEFGGNIEGEYARDGYLLVGCLTLVRDGQFVQTVETEPSYIAVYPANTFSKTMHIEYDCQLSYNIGADTLDTFGKLAAAFHIADTDTDLFRDDLNLPDRLVPWDSLALYHLDNWSYAPGYNMHLLAIHNFTGNTGTMGQSTSGGSYGYSFIFVQHILDFHPVAPSLALGKATVHELGHQRGALTHASGNDPEHPPHPELHNSPFCAMNQGISYVGNNDNDPNNDPPGLKRYFDANPHFCPDCANALRNVNW
jgi:hypothetical protein